MDSIRFPVRRKLLWIVLLMVFAGAAVGLAAAGWAQTKPFLADRHGIKGVNCQSCHKESPPKNAVTSVVCLGCHGDAERLALKTAGVRPNPHDTHLGEMACEECHRAHKPSVDACAKCHHFGLKVP